MKDRDKIAIESLQRHNGTEDKVDDEDIYPLYWSEVEDYFHGLMETYEPIDPFDEYIAGATWIKIPQFGRYYPYVYDSHYIVGLICKEEIMQYIVYGIPGPYAPMPPKGLEGFYCWKPAKSMYGFGYWLLYIDAHTGEVTCPYCG